MKSDTEVPEDVRRLVRACIDSVETLRVLKLLQARRERTWAVDEIRAELRSSTTAATRCLDRLAARGFAVRCGQQFRYAASGDDDAAVKRLAKLYRERRTTVIDMIYSGEAT